jgi:hypothetical protein
METEQEKQARAAAEMQEAAFQRDAEKITELGRETFGAQVFDDAVSTVAGKLGPDGVRVFTQIVSQFDQPHAVVKHLADNEGRLEALGKMPVPRVITEIARIESQMAPHGYTPTGNDPAWKKLPRGGSRMSDSDWNSGLSDKLTDQQFHKEWDRRAAERSKRVR